MNRFLSRRIALFLVVFGILQVTVISANTNSHSRKDRVVIPWLQFHESHIPWITELFESVGNNVAMEHGQVVVYKEEPGIPFEVSSEALAYSDMQRLNDIKVSLGPDLAEYLLKLIPRMKKANLKLGSPRDRNGCIVEFDDAPFDMYDRKGKVIGKDGAFGGQCRECSFLPYSNCDLKIGPGQAEYLHVLDPVDIDQVITKFEEKFDGTFKCLEGVRGEIATSLRTLTAIQIRLNYFVHETNEAVRAYTTRRYADEELLALAVAGKEMSEKQRNEWARLNVKRFSHCHKQSIRKAKRIARFKARATTYDETSINIKYGGIVRWQVVVRLNVQLDVVDVETVDFRVKRILRDAPRCAK